MPQFSCRFVFYQLFNLSNRTPANNANFESYACQHGTIQ